MERTFTARKESEAIEGEPARQSHEYLRNGTAKILPLFHPADGSVRVEGATACPDAVLHGWLRRELTTVLPAGLTPTTGVDEPGANRAGWEHWQDGLSVKPTLPVDPPPPRMLLVLDNLAGCKTPEFVCWLLSRGVMPLYTPAGGSWLNMAESIQRVLKRQALDGQQRDDADQIISWFEAVARHWNEAPTPFNWGGKRSDRRRLERHRVGGSGACTRRPLRRSDSRGYGYVRDKCPTRSAGPRAADSPRRVGSRPGRRARSGLPQARRDGGRAGSRRRRGALVLDVGVRVQINHHSPERIASPA
ncbi:hypothetical protein [Paludisphaera mucosa]|uniref:Tc1-like transposase DDE domain-containing protein n=1 Tax=Paludisphaera mucosa TaxID=3030827 RepID=A0ABT6F4U7_9BACT|nr:hypothetical protein [Paludisphaera mucosa]MDG3002425.1 hypothetical protein [Paludisphaera mucosa]